MEQVEDLPLGTVVLVVLTPYVKTNQGYLNLHTWEVEEEKKLLNYLPWELIVMEGKLL